MKSDGLAKKWRCSPNQGTNIRRLGWLLRLLVATIVLFLGAFASAFGVDISSEVGVVDNFWVKGDRSLWYKCGCKDDNSKHGELRGEVGSQATKNENLKREATHMYTTDVDQRTVNISILVEDVVDICAQ